MATSDEVSFQRPQLTTGTLFVLGAINLVDCINYGLLTPYVDHMVTSFLRTTPDDPQVARTVGLLIGAYSLCEVVFSVFWGWLSDRIGRKPALLIGLAGSAVTPIMFGLAQSLPMAFAARMLDGFFCGNVCVTRTYLGEIVDSTNEARGFSFLAVCFSVGQLIGPCLGGELVYPAQWAPAIFADTVFDSHPYFLPNLSYACFTMFAWVVGAIYLQESLPRHMRQNARNVAVARGPLRGFQGMSSTLLRLLFSYCFLSGCFAAWVQNFIEIVSLPRALDGFALGPQDIGIMQNCGALGLLITQLSLYPRLAKRWGFVSCFIGGWCMHTMVTLLFPVFGLLADPRYGPWRIAPLGFMQFFGMIGSGFLFPTVFVWINRAASEGGIPLGQVNGLSSSLGALFRAITPVISGALLSVGLSANFPAGRYLPVYENCLVMCLALGLALYAFRVPQSNSESAPTRKDPLMSGEAESQSGASTSSVPSPEIQQA